MRSGFDPRRRNRNIGTAKQGHGSDNWLRIPQPWRQDRVFYERLVKPVVGKREIFGREIVFLVEPTRQDSFHPCTLDDVVAVLELLPLEDTWRVANIVLRQPKRKEETLRPVWGRLVYWAELGKYEGVSIYLEAQPRRGKYRRSISQDPPGVQEIERLRQDGHVVKRTSRIFEIESSPEACRNTQLYRTLPHEVGHLVHYYEDLDSGVDHRSRSTREREQFAHAYARSFQESKRKSGAVPFSRKINERRMRAEGLDPKWFVAERGGCS